MIVSEFIDTDIPKLKPSNTREQAMALMIECRCSHLPVFSNKKFIGTISFSALKGNDTLETVEDFKDDILHEYVSHEALITDILPFFVAAQSNVIAVLNRENKFLGMIHLHSVIKQISNFTFFKEVGATLVIEQTIKKYSISEIGKICESCNLQILGLFTEIINSEVLHITLKLNGDDHQTLIETFERFGYKIVKQYFTDKRHELLSQRFKELQRFIEI